MSFASKYNRNTRFNVSFSEDSHYVSLRELFSDEHKVHVLNGFYKNVHGMYGKNYVAVCGDMLVDLPKHLNDTVEAIMKDDAAVESINDKKVGITVYKYNTHNKDCYSINFVDI